MKRKNSLEKQAKNLRIYSEILAKDLMTEARTESKRDRCGI